MIFSSMFAGVDQSIFSKTRKDGLNQLLKRLSKLELKNAISGLSLTRPLILSLNLTSLTVPFGVVLSLLKSSTHPGSEAVSYTHLTLPTILLV